MEREKSFHLKEMGKKENIDITLDSLFHLLLWSCEKLYDSVELTGLLIGSRKAYFKEFKKVVKAADVILEVLDARDPLGCRCTQVEQMILTQDPNKKIILILNKIGNPPLASCSSYLHLLQTSYICLVFDLFLVLFLVFENRSCSQRKCGKMAQIST